jgi:predicted amino acid-binding ACT domain protein
VVFLTPLKGSAARKAAQAEGVAPAKNLATLKVEGDDAPGLGARIVAAIADAGINLRGVSAAVVGRKFVAYLGFENAADATKAGRALRSLSTQKNTARSRR